ncbi:MAG: aminotransferase class IV [Acidimicrobiales bacterium]
MTRFVWLNGSVVNESEARISPFDHGLMVGDGVFETCKVIDGTAFGLRRHLERLARSAKGLGLPLPPAAELRDAVEATIAANGADVVGRVRITVTGGPGPPGSGRGDDGPTILVVATETPPWPETTPVVTVPWPRNERGPIAGLKTISYAENVVALAYANDRGAGEAILPNLAGNVCEGTGTNVFVGVDLQLLKGLVDDAEWASVKAACLEVFEGRAKHGWPPDVAIYGS